MAFLPMLFIASAYYYMNRADPDCGTTFSWVTRAMGPWAGWMGGWAIVVADIIVMANLAQIAGLYSFLLVGWDVGRRVDGRGHRSSASIWIAVMTMDLRDRHRAVGPHAGLPARRRARSPSPCSRSSRSIKVATGDAGPDAVDPSLSWLNPFEVESFDAFVAGILIAIFIYWGWDSTVTVNEESEDSSETPGKAAIVATIILLGIYVLVAVAAQAYNGAAGADRQRRRRAQRARHRRLRLAAGQDPHHRRAHLGGRVDADDDPAHGAHVAVDGAPRRDAQVARPDPPALPDAARLDDPHGRASRSSGTSG